VAPAYDRQRIVENLGGDEELLAEIARMFFIEAETSVPAIRAAIDNADAKALHNVAHSLKGAVSNFAADRATAAAAALEQCGKLANLAPAERLFVELSAAVSDLVAALRADFGQID
jgi:HPt (histidine-containing phosphotransfer) domain-containing protein